MGRIPFKWRNSGEGSGHLAVSTRTLEKEMQKLQAKEVRGGMYGVDSTAPLVVGKPAIAIAIASCFV